MLREILAIASSILLSASALADTGMRIIVPSHDIARGATIAASDRAYATIAASNVFSGVVTSTDELAGMEARRVLHAGEAVRLNDVRHPILITRGSVVTMTFEVPGVLLTASGRAMSEGGMGDSVTIQNPTSFRQITATVIGSGAVRALRGANPSSSANELAAATR